MQLAIINVPEAREIKSRQYETIRKDYATSIDENAVHGSDAEDTAKTECINFIN